MKIHEYQAKELFREFGIPVPRGHLAITPRMAELAAQTLKSPKVVVKSQLHAGGRGKGHFVNSDGGRGVRVADSPAQARDYASAMLGHVLQTAQTGSVGARVRRLYIEEGLEIARELYLGTTLDRSSGRLTFMASPDGGMEIEEVAAKTPERIFRAAIDPALGLLPYQCRLLAHGLGLAGESARQFEQLAQGLYRLFLRYDASLCEINPLVLLKSGDLVALDAKLAFDDNALFRHPELTALRDIDEEEESEAAAKEHDLSYVHLEGDIGCMVNGAGLAMATMDTIKLVGGEPANFLDVGGGASKEKVAAAFKLILRDPAVRAVLVNIFGGIMKCDTIAEGIISAAREVELRIPLVVRLEGTHVEQGRALLERSGLSVITANDLREAAAKAVAAARAPEGV